MMGQLYADLEEIENLGVDLTDIGAVWNAAKDHGYEHVEIIVSNFPDNYLRLISAWLDDQSIEFDGEEDEQW
ncbi:MULTISPECIES: hypothetical protein [Actinomycetaceae]|nr:MULTISPECIES: hypothetical protein [Actinomycetaceae]CRH92024.1 Uncharacterised protein [Chlamydia trachomatis]BDY02511.1 hypothetical protein TPCV302_19030 [Cutibacterium avidum]MDU6112370.1 hypothetical protein [Winkia neuii]MDY5160081.1 hypothetical protein [Actinotignum urinale]WIK90056.1 hypothetical protein CYJ20_007395 [Winkia neuii]